MKPQDYLGMTVFVGFGLWWVLLPDSVIRFYGWFHRGKLSMPGPLTVRMIGLAWIALVLSVTLHGLK